MSNRPVHGSQASRAKTRPQQIQYYRKRLYLACFCMLGVIVLLAMAAGFKTVWFSQTVERETQSARAEATHNGTIVLQKDENRCEQMKFDNDGGRIIENFKPCDNTIIRDAHGAPLPMGTVHRLDAISKSFLGNGR